MNYELRIMEMMMPKSMIDKQAQIIREWEQSQTDRQANADKQIAQLGADTMPKYNQLFSVQTITPALINAAIQGKRTDGRLMELNALFGLFMDNDDNLIHCVNITKEALKKATWKYDRKLTKAQAAWYDQIITANLKQWIDMFVDGKLYGHQFWQVLYDYYHEGHEESTKDTKLSIKEAIDYHDKMLDIRLIDRKLALYIQDKPVELDSEIKFIMKPYKQPILQSILKYYVFYAFAINNWAQFTETYGKPPRIGTYEPTASPAEVALLKRMVQDLGTDQAAVIAKTCNIEFKDFAGKTASADLFERLCDYVEGRVTKAILGQTLTTNATKNGTQALGNVQNEIRKDIRDGYLGDLSDIVSEILRRLAILNGSPAVRVEFEVQEPINHKDRMDVVTGAAKLGLRIGTAYMYKTFDIPEPAEGDEVLRIGQTPGSDPTDTPPDEPESPQPQTRRDGAPAGTTRLEACATASPGAAYLNAAIDDMAPVLMGIRQKIRGCQSIEELDGLNLYAEAAALGNKLGVGVARAYVAGRQRTRRKGESIANYELRIMNYECATATFEQDRRPALHANAEAIIQFGWSENDVELVNVFRTQVMTISGVRTAEQLAILKEAAISAMEDGGAFQDYIKNADLAGFAPDNPYHFRTEYDTAFSAAQMAGQWQSINEDKDIFPYLRYVTMLDDQVRDEHAALEGYIAAVDDDFWAVNYPPNGWNCRCDVEQLLESEAEADPKFGEAPQDSPVTEGFGSNAGVTRSLPNNTDADFERAAYDYIAARLPDWAVRPKYDEVNATGKTGETQRHRDTEVSALSKLNVIDWAGYPVRLPEGSTTNVEKDMISKPEEVWQIPGNGLLILKRYDSYTGVLAIKRGKCGVCAHETDNQTINAKRRGILVYGA